MKKRIIAIVGILVILIIACIAKFAFVNAANESSNEDISIEKIVEQSRVSQPVVDGKYKPLEDSEISNFSKVFQKGDVNNDGIIDTDDAKMALEIYSDCILAKQRNETKGEIYRADVDKDNVVTIDDGITLLMFINEVSLDESKTLTLDAFLDSYLKAE